MLDFFFIATVAAALALMITPGVSSVALRLGAVKNPKASCPRQPSRPCLGGLTLALSFLGTALFALLIPAFGDSLWIFLSAWSWVLCGPLIILGVGIADDIRELSAGTKLICQLPAGLIVVMAVCEVSAIADPFTGAKLDAGWLYAPLAFLWVVGITNAFNLIDGLDGLAAGVALIASLTLVAVSLKSGHFDVAIAAVMIAGALAGFLCYNFPPASSFLGDSGSMLLGYLLSVFYIQGARDETGGLVVLVPALSLGLPIADTTLAVMRRIMRRPRSEPHSPGTAAWIERLASVLHADQEHLHHRLIARGLNQRRAVLLLYTVSLGLSSLALLAMELRGAWNALLLGTVGLGTFLGLKKLGYDRIYGRRE